MRAKSIAVAVAALVTLIATGAADAAIVGRWNVDGFVTVKVTVSGDPQLPETIDFQETFRFLADRSFRILGGVPGTWKRNPNVTRGYIVQLNRAQGEEFVEEYVAQAGYPGVQVTLTMAKITAVENAARTQIQGRVTFKGSFNFQGTPGTFSVSGPYTGTRVTALMGMSTGERPSLFGALVDLMTRSLPQ